MTVKSQGDAGRTLGRRARAHATTVPALTAIVAVMGAARGASPLSSPLQTTSSSCRDRGGVVWKLRSSWGDPYTSNGVRRVRTYGTEFTTSAPVTRVQYAIRTYDGSGRLVQTLQGRRSFDFDHNGVSWLRRNPVDPILRRGE